MGQTPGLCSEMATDNGLSHDMTSSNMLCHERSYICSDECVYV